MGGDAVHTLYQFLNPTWQRFLIPSRIDLEINLRSFACHPAAAAIVSNPSNHLLTVPNRASAASRIASAAAAPITTGRRLHLIWPTGRSWTIAERNSATLTLATRNNTASSTHRRSNGIASLQRRRDQKRRIQNLAKNNLALDLKHSAAEVWLLGPGAKDLAKNNLASCQFFIFQPLAAASQARIGS